MVVTERGGRTKGSPFLISSSSKERTGRAQICYRSRAYGTSKRSIAKRK